MAVMDVMDNLVKEVSANHRDAAYRNLLTIDVDEENTEETPQEVVSMSSKLKKAPSRSKSQEASSVVGKLLQNPRLTYRADGQFISLGNVVLDRGGRVYYRSRGRERKEAEPVQLTSCWAEADSWEQVKVTSLEELTKVCLAS